MKTVLMAFSAATPAILFSFLLLKFNIRAAMSSRNLKPAFPFSNVLAHVFEQHFDKLIAVEIESNQQKLKGLIDAKPNGTYRLLTMDRNLIVIIRKNKVGWLIIQKGKNVKNASQYFIPLILLLENKFYN